MELKGKPLSLGAKILGALISIAGLVLKATIAPDLPIDAVLKVAGFVVVFFASVDVSLWLEKIFLGKGESRGSIDYVDRRVGGRGNTGNRLEELQEKDGGR
jgi:hypothetical protein